MRNNMSTKESRRHYSETDSPSENGASVANRVEWLGRESNAGHRVFQTLALPTELPSRRNRGNLRHGHTNGKGYLSPTYISWQRMKQRCQYPKHRSYPLYGGRGIKVCDRWQKFEGFIEDMGERPAGKSIGRIDNDGHYEPANCKWSTLSEQNTAVWQVRSRRAK